MNGAELFLDPTRFLKDGQQRTGKAPRTRGEGETHLTNFILLWLRRMEKLCQFADEENENHNLFLS